MSIKENASKFAQSILTLDDMVLGQSLMQGGWGGLGKVGLSKSGPAIALNVGARMIFLSAQVATKAAELPLRGDAKTLVGKVGDKAKSMGERCSGLAIQGIELAGGKKAQNPITKQEWLAKQALPGYTAGELTADSTLGTLETFVVEAFALGMDALSLTTETIATETVLKAVDASLDKVPGRTANADSSALKGGLYTVAWESGVPLAATSATLAVAAGRLAFADARALHTELSRGVERAKLLAAANTEEGAPGMRVNAKVYEGAKKLAEHPPQNLIDALERSASGEAPKPLAILTAMIKDGRALVQFFSLYPQILSMLGADLMQLVGTPPALQDMMGKKDKKSKGKKSKGTEPDFDLLDSLVGSAVTEDGETPLFPRAIVNLAQDVSYRAAFEKEGRSAALKHVAENFGAEAAERIANDISLDPEIIDAEASDRPGKIRAYIDSVSDDNALATQIELCSQRLAQLESSETVAVVMLATRLTDRIKALRSFTSLANGDLGIRGIENDDPTPSRDAFLGWASSQA
ncbi:MAG: hypothetical protein ACI8UO_005594 [Verrucomicrobiales bacterium]|jgi:hypothetical protein